MLKWEGLAAPTVEHLPSQKKPSAMGSSARSMEYSWYSWASQQHLSHSSYLSPMCSYTLDSIPGLYISAMVITFVLMIVLACCDSVRRAFPVNLILLLLFTVCEGVLLGTVSSFYEVKEVMIAVGICTVVCLGLTLFAFQTKWDFTAMSGILFVCALVFMCFGFALIFIKGDIVRLVYACIGALLFSVYLVFDTQLMLGGNHKYSVSPEEYIFAALSLYVDVINLFLMILQIVGYANRD
ncbi:hypothetical protein MTO96_008279 [Rhipicephalus appendiculatus]